MTSDDELTKANVDILAHVAKTMVNEYLERKKNSTNITKEEIIELGKQITAEQEQRKLV